MNHNRGRSDVFRKKKNGKKGGEGKQFSGTSEILKLGSSGRGRKQKSVRNSA